MRMHELSRRLWCTAALSLCLAVAQAAQAAAQPLSMRIPDETVAAGGVLQAKLDLTEPRPIQTGGGGMSFADYQDFLGLAVNSPNGDAAAVGVMRGSTLRLRMVSPTSDIGSSGEYPILATTLRVPATAVPGTQSLLAMTGAQFTGPGGVAYAHDVRPGIATVGPAGTAAVIDVSPGSATVPAGGTIVIHGLGFEPGTKVKLKEVATSSVEFVNSTTLIVRPATSVQMHAQEIEIEIPSTRQKLVYYSYQRTMPLGRSIDPLIAAVEPAFPRQFWTSALVRFNTPAANDVFGIAVQNEGSAPSQVSLSLTTGATVIGPLRFTMPANARAARSLAEVFGTTCAGGCALRMTSSQPLHIFGLAGDRAADAVMPVLPTSDVATVLDFATATNAAVFRTGELLHVTGRFTPGVASVAADGYVVLVTPAGDYLSLTPLGLLPGIRPLFRPAFVTDPATVDLLRVALPPGVPMGRYQWLSALAVPGTLNLLTPIRVTPFDIVP
jgi:IPT/TIG domain